MKGGRNIANNTYGEIELQGCSPIPTRRQRITNVKPDDFINGERKRKYGSVKRSIEAQVQHLVQVIYL